MTQLICILLKNVNNESSTHALKYAIFNVPNIETPQLLLPTPLTNQGLSCDGSYCCNKTLLQVAKWDFEVREKCHVLRSIKPDKVWNH